MDNTLLSGLLQPLPIQTWAHITIDFMKRLSNSNGFNSSWVIVDRLTKYSYFTFFMHPYTTKTVVELFIKHIFKHYRLYLSQSSMVETIPPQADFGKNFSNSKELR